MQSHWSITVKSLVHCCYIKRPRRRSIRHRVEPGCPRGRGVRSNGVWILKLATLLLSLSLLSFFFYTFESRSPCLSHRCSVFLLHESSLSLSLTSRLKLDAGHL